GNGVIRIGEAAAVQGALAAQQVLIGERGALRFEDGFAGPAVAPQPIDDGNPCTVDACDSMGRATHTPVADGTGCDDGNPCTQTDTCQAGACTGADPVTCFAADQCHVPGLCDPASGLCTNPARADGASCSDGDACTQSDTCQAGACTGANPVTCAASDQCHLAGTCDHATGACSNPARPDGASCTQTATCQAGACTCAHPVPSTAADQCHLAGPCDPATGPCSNPARPDGASCSDGDACTRSDSCQAGACTGSNLVTCSAMD